MCSHHSGGGGEAPKPKAVSVAAPQQMDMSKNLLIDNVQNVDVQRRGKRRLTIDLNSSGGTGLNI